MTEATPRYRIVRGLLTALVGHFYGVTVRGQAVPQEGPVLLVANHPNAAVDPLLLLRLCERPVRFVAKSTAFDVPFVGFFVRALLSIHAYRAMDGQDTNKNTALFSACSQALQEHSVIGLFPEGISHSEPSLQRLKTGAARMAFDAEASRGFSLGVQIVPVGLLYEDKGVYRSRVTCWVGEAMGLDDLQATFITDDHGASRQLTERIAEGIRSVTWNLERWDDLPLLSLADQIWPESSDLGGHAAARIHRLIDALQDLRERHPDKAELLLVEGQQLRRELASHGLSHLVPRTNPSLHSIAGLRTLAALLWLIALPGALIWLVPYQAVRLLVAGTRQEADMAATVKLVASLLFYPATLLAWTWAATQLGGPPSAVAAMVLAPVLGVGTRRCLDGAVALWERTSESLAVRRLGEARAPLLSQQDALARAIRNAADSLTA